MNFIIQHLKIKIVVQVNFFKKEEMTQSKLLLDDIKLMKIAEDIDPDYFNEIKKAKKNGVKIIAYSCNVNEKEISVNKKIKVVI